MRIGVLTGGGDAPGLNAAIRAVVRQAARDGHQVSGVRDGWAGALSGEVRPLLPADVRGLLREGGTVLGSSRTNPLQRPDGLEQVRQSLRAAGIDSLVAMGGDDTLSVARALAEGGYPVVGVPKTIDNDLAATDFCIGFDTAVGIVAESLDRLRTTVASHHRVMVVEVMGREVGWVATMGGLAGGADFVLIPEFPVSTGELLDHLHRRREEGEDFSLVVVAEGVTIPGVAQRDDGGTDAFGHVRLADRGVGEILSRFIERETGFEARVTVLGHLQRGGSPSSLDRIWATRLGVRAAELAGQGASGVIPVRRGEEVAVVTLAEVVGEHRRVPRDLYELTRS
jgi:6-phosphofructokinase 1